MIIWNPHDDWIDEESGADLRQCSERFRRLLPHVLSAPAATIEVLFLKIDDSLRRRRKTAKPYADTTREDIDRLLDYWQALEAILPIPGSEIPLRALELLQSGTQFQSPGKSNVADLFRDMYSLRNSVMHGRYDQVVENRAGTQNGLKDVDLFRMYVHELAVLYLLNPDKDGKPNLRQFVKPLRKGHPIKVETL